MFTNPALTLLAIALADRAFQDYGTLAEIEAIPPPTDGSRVLASPLFHLHICKDFPRLRGHSGALA